MKHVPKLTSLPYTARIGIAVLMLTLLGGYVVSGIHLKTHYDNRDGSPGFTLGDIRGHYHGVQSPSPLVASLQQDHPDAETLPDDKRKALLDWLAETDKLSEQYDNFDLGDNAPAEIIAVSCLDCHSRNSTGPDAHPSVPLEFWSDIQEIAFSKDIQPTSEAVLAMSQHTHAPDNGGDSDYRRTARVHDQTPRATHRHCAAGWRARTRAGHGKLVASTIERGVD